MTIDLCHVFVFVPDRATAEQALASCGLAVAFERRHPGQGTANLCTSFGDAYLELLWAEDEAELISAPVVRTRLAERARWRETRASPFGIGLRGNLPFPYWDYRPAYMPEGTSIAVALASEDPRQPFLFRSPGESRPKSGRGEPAIADIRLELPVAPSPALKTLAERAFLSLSPAVAPRLELTVSDGRRLVLPDFVWK